MTDNINIFVLIDKITSISQNIILLYQYCPHFKSFPIAKTCPVLYNHIL